MAQALVQQYPGIGAGASSRSGLGSGGCCYELKLGGQGDHPNMEQLTWLTTKLGRLTLGGYNNDGPQHDPS